MDIMHKLNIYTVFLGNRLAGRIENIGDDVESILMEFKRLRLSYRLYKGIEYDKDYIIFSKNKDIVEYLYLSHTHILKNRDEILGRIYGYPTCCSSNITKILKLDNPLEQKKYSLKDNKGMKYSYRMNIFYEYRLFFHIPCSLDCKKSLKIAIDNEKILKVILKNNYKQFINKFKGKFIFNGKEYLFV